MISGGKPGYLAEVRDCGSGGVEANARLIAAAPTMHEYIARRAEAGDNEAKKILESINAGRSMEAFALMREELRRERALRAELLAERDALAAEVASATACRPTERMKQ